MSNSSGRVESRWNSQEAPTDGLDLLVYASNQLGSDPRITNFGGGNTSSKIVEADPLTGNPVEVLWVKASGGDLGSATRTGFASLYEEKVLALERRFRAGLDEDSIVPLYMRAVFDSNPAAPSIDTPLHAFVPNRCVSHMHSDAVISVAANEHPERLMGEIYGQQMGFLPWKRPGFQLGLMLRDLIEEHPNINSALMAQHGFICWAETWEECYSLTIRVINQAVEFIEHKKKAKTGHAVQTKGADASPQILLDFLPELREELLIRVRGRSPA